MRKTLSVERRELIDALVAEADLGGISAGLLEKDEHLTDTLQLLFDLQLEGMQLVFCGGTSLSKAHGLIERMSEDVDLKIVLFPEMTKLSRGQLRKRLSAAHELIAKTLADTGLEQNLGGKKKLNENRYFCSEWRYERAYDSVIGLRPNLQIELTVRTPVLPTTDMPITRLADQLAKRDSESYLVPTVALAETVAEKVLSFLRRFSQNRAGEMRQSWDVALVRHIYDVHCAYLAGNKIVTSAAIAFPSLVKQDGMEFGKQFPPFGEHPLSVLDRALQESENDEQSQEEYQQNLLPLIYGDLRPSYPQAFSSFKKVADEMLRTIKG